jgi:hypothetical protein
VRSCATTGGAGVGGGVAMGVATRGISERRVARPSRLGNRALQFCLSLQCLLATHFLRPSSFSSANTFARSRGTLGAGPILACSRCRFASAGGCC